MKAGQDAPDFSLPDQDGKTHTLSQYRGRWVLVYFYPRDDTPGCTKEACGIRDIYAQYTDANITVLGVSKDTVASHKKFAEKYRLPFTILADEKKEVVTLYGVLRVKKMMGRESIGVVRHSFLIDPDGKITKIFTNVKPETHAQEVLDVVQDLSGS